MAAISDVVERRSRERPGHLKSALQTRAGRFSWGLGREPATGEADLAAIGIRGPREQVKTVVFPAPLGPIIPSISPCASTKVALAHGLEPPENRLLSPVPRGSSCRSASSRASRGAGYAPGAGTHHGNQQEARTYQ